MPCCYDVLIHVHSSHIQHIHNSFLIEPHVTLEVNRAVVAELLSSHPVKNNKLDILRMIQMCC